MGSRVKALSFTFMFMGTGKFAAQTLLEKHFMRTFRPSSTLVRFVGITLAMLLLHSNANAQVDPPGRVARISYSSGNLSLAIAGSEQWTDVAMNRPISVGDSLWVPERGRAELHVGSSAIRLSERSNLTFLTLSDDSIQLKLTRGTMIVRLRNLSGKEAFEINTPNLAFSLQEVGEYRVTVNDDNTTNVMVRRGAAIAYGDRDSISIREAEQVLFSGTNLNHNAINRMPPYDTFDQWVNDRDRAEDTSVSARYVSREVIGYQQLDEHGTWETNAEYGAVWLPRTTEIGWAPYRNGNWLWVAPWGWTWVDRAPWGFAPYHYGRWAYIGVRWAWVPGLSLHYERPVYAPALVAFVGGGNGLSVSLHIGSGPGVAWFPLAPGEAYRPSYYASPRYLDGVNRRSGTNITVNNTTINNTTINNTTIYANQHVHNAVTAVPTSTFVKGQFVGGAGQSLTRDQLLTSQVGAGAPAISPSSDSLLGTSRRIGNPDNSAVQYRNRPVVATFKPADLPVVQDSNGRYNPALRRGDIDKEPRSGGNVNLTSLRSRAIAEPANFPIAPAASTIASSPVLLHNGGRSDNRNQSSRFNDRENDEISGADRRSNNANAARRPLDAMNNAPVMGVAPSSVNGAPVEQIRRSGIRSDERDAESDNRRSDIRERNERFNNQTNGADRRNNNDAVSRRTQENNSNMPVAPNGRMTPDPVVNMAPMDQNRRPAIRNEERDTESGNRQFNNPRPVQNNSDANRMGQRRDDASLNGFAAPRENIQSAPVQRPVERVFQAPREVSRPANPEPPAQQAPRVERQPANEPRREVPAAVAKPEREKERKDRSDSRERMEK